MLARCFVIVCERPSCYVCKGFKGLSFEGSRFCSWRVQGFAVEGQGLQHNDTSNLRLRRPVPIKRLKGVMIVRARDGEGKCSR